MPDLSGVTVWQDFEFDNPVNNTKLNAAEHSVGVVTWTENGNGSGFTITSTDAEKTISNGQTDIGTRGLICRIDPVNYPIINYNYVGKFTASFPVHLDASYGFWFKFSKGFIDLVKACRGEINGYGFFEVEYENSMILLLLKESNDQLFINIYDDYDVVPTNIKTSFNLLPHVWYWITGFRGNIKFYEENLFGLGYKGELVIPQLQEYQAFDLLRALYFGLRGIPDNPEPVLPNYDDVKLYFDDIVMDETGSFPLIPQLYTGANVVATEMLPIGQPVTLVANQIYALPAVAVTLFAVGSPTITQGNVVDTVATAVTLTNNQATLAGGFLKCTTGTVITLKRA